ncbi:DNA damage-inducible protein 1-like [Chenopodium quinoa]|uniref:DNA damage-inducible protein 1-like n=1 Tax=Chenopodium quinoa TaxID=63459 RepID=UPI000B793B02|nr:DNA damage-inducible protein 1-like [Chenopodium quinoa]
MEQISEGFSSQVLGTGKDYVDPNLLYGLNHEFRIYIDAASGGSLLTKNPTKVKELIEKMTANDNYHPGGRNNVKKGGKLDVYALTLLTSSVQALTSKFDRLQAGSSSSSPETCEIRNLEDPPVREPLKEVLEGVVTTEKAIDGSVIEEELKASSPPPPAPYVPQVPFPQRLAQAKLEKKICSNKKKLEENATVALTAECSAILQNTLLKKLGDPGSYSIPVKLGDIEINRALCDLGASVSLMPLSICKKLEMGELKPTRISLQLADRSVKFPLGVLEDVPLRVGKFFIPCDFVVMEMEEDAHVPIILGRPFLATVVAIIDMKNGKITFEVGDEKME